MIEKIPLGFWIQQAIQFLTSRFENQFRAVSDGLGSSMSAFIQILLTVHPLICVGFVGVLIYGISRNWKNSAFAILGLLLIINLGYWQETLETVTLVMISTLISTAIGVPIGVLCAHQKWLDRVESQL